MPRVSVIIPTCNRCTKVLKAIRSAMEQTFLDHEIIVVDDGSSDATLNTVSQLPAPVKCIAHSSNMGVSAARNTGIRHSNSPYIAFLDSDDHWLPEKLAVQIEYFESHGNIQACQTEEVWIRKGRRVNPMNKHKKPSGDIFEPSLKRCLVSPSAVMLRKSLLDEVGMFDESLPACEDYDLWLRISCRYPVSLIQQPLVVKEGGHPDQLSTRYRGMDRFRIQSIEKLIKSGILDQRQRAAAVKELSHKCRIYGNGCLKRGKIEEGNYYLNLPERLTGKIAS